MYRVAIGSYNKEKTASRDVLKKNCGDGLLKNGKT